MGSGAKVFKSTDRGTTWKTVFTAPGSGISRMHVQCDSTGTTWAFMNGAGIPEGVPAALYRTTNGTQWKAVVDTSVSEAWAKAPQGTNDPVALATPSSNTAYLVTEYVIGQGGYRVGKTTNGGRTWNNGSHLLADGITPYPDNGPVQISFPSATDGWLVAEQGSSLTILRTTNGGRTWNEVDTLPLS